MYKCVIVFVGAILLPCSSSQANPKSWNELTRTFLWSISSHRELKPNLQGNIESFFDRYMGTKKDQLLHVETQRHASDTVLDFLAFNCYGILKQVVPRRQENRERFLQLAIEHLFHEALLRLDKLSDSELSRVIRASLTGKYNVMMTLTNNRLFAARDRLMYFLIAKSFNTPELAMLAKQAIEAHDIACAMGKELQQLRRPLFESWEEIEDVDDFFEREMERRIRTNFLTQVLDSSF